MPLDHFIHAPRVYPHERGGLVLIKALILHQVPDMGCHCSSYRRTRFSCCSHVVTTLDERARQALTESAP